MLILGKRLHLSQGDVEFLAMVCEVSEATIRAIEEPDSLLKLLQTRARTESSDSSEVKIARRLLLPRYLAALGDETARELPWCGDPF